VPSKSNITIGGRTVDPVRGGLLFLLVGLAVTGYGAYDYFQQQESIDAAESVTATVVETGVESDSTGSSTDVDYYPTVRFEYTYRGETYTSNEVYPASVRRSYDTESAARDVVDEYDVGSSVTAYVPPESPGDAFLRDEQTHAPLVAVGIGVAFVLLGARTALAGRTS
jgi:hypothetical protein